MIALPSIRQKLLAVVMATTLAAVLVSVCLFIAYDLRIYQRSLHNDLSTQAELIGHMTSVALAFDDPRLAAESLALLRNRPMVNSAAIFDERGRLFASYPASGAPAVFPARPGASEPRIEGDHLVLFRPIVENGGTVGTVWLRAEHRLLERALDYFGMALGVTLLALAVAWLLMRRIGRIITTPIVAITDIARDVIATRDYSRRAQRIGNDEAAELADSFNAMLVEIEQRTRALEGSNAEIVREAQERARAQQEIMRLNEQLEHRVDERTRQLALANAELANAIEEAQSANQAKSAFLSSMSHELRTPLNAVLGFAQILTSDLLPTSEVQKKEFANHILKSGRHLLTLINEILDLAKVESGTISLSMEPVELGEILRECRDMVAPLAAARGVRVLFPADASAMLLADRTRLKQVLLNLLSNAIKYNRDAGAGAVVLDCTQVNPERLRIAVHDSGTGLRADQVDSLFQPFNRLGQEAGAQEGTGIGLVVTRRLVELMGGTIDVTSNPGVGSVFSFELTSTAPLAAKPDPAGQLAPAPVERVDQAPHLLLYVEDNPANLKLVEEIVRFRPDLHLLAASDGPLGLSLARTHLPEIILMDLNLPGMSGFDVLKQFQLDPRTRAIPVIALTADAMASDIERGLTAGFFRYLTKPVDIDRFNEAIDGTLAHLRAAAVDAS